MQTIAVIFGGRSVEHDVSIITAHIPVINSLLAGGQFRVFPVYIGKDGSWFSDPAMNDLAYFQSAAFPACLAKLKKLRLLFDNGLKIIRPGALRSQIISIDIVFPALHGTFGEDGSLMGLLRLADVPFVGCDLSASAVAMDKVLTKQVVAAAGIPVVPFVWFTKNDWETDKNFWRAEISKLKMPLFIKPPHLGSSIAIAKIKDASRLDDAIAVALHYDDKVLVEESVANLIEVTLPIMGNDTLRLAAIERPLPKTEFFDFEEKYLGGGKKSGGVNSEYSEIPAEISSALSERVQELGRRTYRALNCSGLARVDFLIDSVAGQVYVNEVNPLPGSLYHHNWQRVGISGVDLVTELITLAKERFTQTKNLTFTFRSSVLKKSSGPKFQ